MENLKSKHGGGNKGETFFSRMPDALIKVYMVGGIPLACVFVLAAVALPPFSFGSSEVNFEVLSTALVNIAVFNIALVPILGFMRWRHDVESKEKMTTAIFEVTARALEDGSVAPKHAESFARGLTTTYQEIASMVADYDPKEYMPKGDPEAMSAVFEQIADPHTNSR